MNTTTDETSRPGQAPPPPPAPARPPLRRRRDDRIIGGVAGGIADHLRVDVALVRIVLVVLGLVNGLGVLLYLIAWVAVPEAEHGDAVTTASSRDGREGRSPRFWVGMALLGLGTLALITGPLALLPGDSAPQLVVPLALIGFGLALWRAGDHDDGAPQGDGPPPPPVHREAHRDFTSSARADVAADAPAGTDADHLAAPASVDAARPDAAGGSGGSGASGVPGKTGGPGGPGAEQTRGDEPPPPARRGPGAWVTRATLGLVLVVVGLLWTLRLAGVAALGAGTMLAAALLVVGLGLLVGSVVGGGRWLLLAGGLLLPFVLIAQLAGPGVAALVGAWDGGQGGRASGQVRLAPTDLDELEPSYRIGAGSFELDLRGVEFDEEPTVVEVEVGAGQIEVTVPDDVELVAVGQTGIGQVALFDERSGAGLGAGPVRAERTPPSSAGSVELHLSAGVGQVVVTTAPAAP